MRSASAYGHSASRTADTMLNTVTHDPMPSAMTAMMAAARERPRHN
jgi:hypothetical protein